MCHWPPPEKTSIVVRTQFGGEPVPRAERAGRTWSDYPPVLERLGVSAADWERAVRVTSRQFSRELPDHGRDVGRGAASRLATLAR